MTKDPEIELDFEIDKLTNSIENTITKEVLETQISIVSNKSELLSTDWLFNWEIELKDNTRTVYKLTTITNPQIIQGLISITDKNDHIYLNLIESAKINKGKNKLYVGVAGNLVAFACKYSFEKGYNGIISFVAKTSLIDHYKNTLGAKLFGINRMYIDTKEALFLVKNYFKSFEL